MEQQFYADGEPMLTKSDELVFKKVPHWGDDCDTRSDYRLNFYWRIALRCGWTLHPQPPHVLRQGDSSYGRQPLPSDGSSSGSGGTDPRMSLGFLLNPGVYHVDV
jgi:hypothetical protein